MKDEERDVGEWLRIGLAEKITMLKERGIDASALYTIADVLGWTWEQESRERVPEEWSQEKGVQLSMEIMLKVGECPTLSLYDLTGIVI